MSQDPYNAALRDLFGFEDALPRFGRSLLRGTPAERYVILYDEARYWLLEPGKHAVFSADPAAAPCGRHLPVPRCQADRQGSPSQ